MAANPAVRPVRFVIVDDNLERSRLTVFFRLFLALPVLFWLTLRGIAAYVAAFALWLAVLIEGRGPESIHDFVASYVRYATQVGAYVLLAANSYPWFRVHADYQVDVHVAPPARQSRWTGFFRLVLALPAIALATVLGGGFADGSPQFSRVWASPGTERLLSWTFAGGGVAFSAAFLTWFVVLARGKAPRGLRDLIAYTLCYAAQAAGYLLLVTGRYPSADPALVEPLPDLPEHPVRIVVTDELERSRMTVFFRLFLALPHFVWLTLWAIVAFFAAIAAWFAALVSGRVPGGLHRFLAAYVRYSVHVYAFATLVGAKFPAFTGRARSYGIDVDIDPPGQQNRWITLFRLVLVVPAVIVQSALGAVLFVVAFLAWWFALFTGRMPEGLRNLGASCLRYGAQTSAYFFLLTDRYPYASPVLEGRAATIEEPAAPLLGDAF